MEGRRFICGRVLEVTKDGLVVESGYSTLNREPLNRSWLVTRNVEAKPDSNSIEANYTGAMAVGLVYLMDFPKRPAVQKYDYVLLSGFPAGQYEYTPVAPIKKTIRKFSVSLELAVDRRLADDGYFGK